MLKQLTPIACAIALSGCATIVNDTAQGVRIDTKTPTGEVVTGAACTITNERGSVEAKSGDTAKVHRSGDDLNITCKHPQNADANARAVSRANMGLAGNIVFGGGIGAIIDHSKGTAYTYPTWVQLVFGKTLVFDRSDEKEGEPVVGKEPGTEKTASGN